jgi:uncharacterized Zn finger protein
MTDPVAGSRRRDGHAWWSSRFLALVEGMTLPDPLRAGRALARTEAVAGVRRSGNLVVAMVRDQGEDLHKARLAVRAFGDGDWRRAEEALAAQARFAAALLAGSMPDGIEEVLASLGLSLFPTRADDLAMDCTCADWQRPCAHLVASCHRLAEVVDLDPFALLALRGRERDALFDGIRRARQRFDPTSAGRVRRFAWPSVVAAEPDRPAVAPENAGAAEDALPNEIAAFWAADRPAYRWEAPPGARASVRPDILLDLCGELTVEPSGDLREALRPAYQVFAGRGVRDRAPSAPPDAPSPRP